MECNIQEKPKEGLDNVVGLSPFPMELPTDVPIKNPTIPGIIWDNPDADNPDKSKIPYFPPHDRNDDGDPIIINSPYYIH
ncbi:hypothetical protein ACFLZX_04365 [Nanoarchaeota archaeon]